LLLAAAGDGVPAPGLPVRPPAPAAVQRAVPLCAPVPTVRAVRVRVRLGVGPGGAGAAPGPCPEPLAVFYGWVLSYGFLANFWFNYRFVLFFGFRF